jgi:uncharacterized protein YecT (DUF1311 family)
MRYIRGAVLSAAIFAGTPASAQTAKQIEARYSRDYNRCLNSGDAANGATYAMRECNSAEIGRQDVRLNQAYKMVMARLNAPQKKTLRMSERTWILERDAQCRREAAEAEGGTLQPILYGGCILNETIKRTMWLEAYRG